MPNTLNILIIDSSEKDALIIGELLSMSDIYSYEIYHVLTLGEASILLQEIEIEVILVNLFLPDSFGIHTFNNLFRSYPNTPFIILTEMEDDSVGKNAVQKGAQDFLVKSQIDVDILNKSIAYAIERKNTEEQLRKSEEKYKELFLRSNDAIYMSTVEGSFIDINPSGLKLFGYSPEDLDYISVNDLYVYDGDREVLMKKLEVEGEVSDYEVDLLKKDGCTVLHCLLSSIAVKNEIGKVVGYQGIIKDMTDKKKAEEALIRSLRELDITNKELQLLNTTLEQKVEERTKQLLLEKENVENKNNEIKESINYARRIQASILPPIEKIKERLKSFFIFYEPKDIVSGDFYWFDYAKNKALLSVIDCTGHGVPGAFMSIIGYTQLNEIVSDHKITDPGMILKELDRRVRIALNQNKGSEFNSKDGMELGLIAIDFENKRIEFAGAMRPLYFVKDNSFYIIKGDKYSIGGWTRHRKSFKTHKVNYSSGDSFYLFSDGYPDQFGGPKGKKFMTRNVGEMIKSMAHLAMKEQGEIVKSAMYNWMRDDEQVDDILFVGVQM